MVFNKVSLTNLFTMFVLVFAICAALVTFKPAKTYAVVVNGVDVTYCKLSASGGVKVRVKFVAPSSLSGSRTTGLNVINYYSASSFIYPAETKYLISTVVPNSSSVKFTYSVNGTQSNQWSVGGLLWC